MVYTLSEGVSEGLRRKIVLLPIRRIPSVARLMIVPLSVAAGPFAKMVVPAIEKTEGLGVKI